MTAHRKGCWETTSHLPSQDGRVCGRAPLSGLHRPLQALRLVTEGNPPSPGTLECLCCRTETKPWSTTVSIKDILMEKEFYALYESLSSPTSPPQKVAPPPWPLANPATLFFPTPHIPLVTLLSLLAPELCSHACAGQASPFPGWPPSPFRGPPSCPHTALMVL